MNNIITRPMKAADVEKDANDDNDLTTVNFPVIASPKLDGIRCVHPYGRGPLTSTFKPIPNIFIRNALTRVLPEGMDGEIMIPGKDYNDIQSEVMSYYGEPQFEFHAFDSVQEDLNEPFENRISACMEKVRSVNSKFLKGIPHVEISSISELERYEKSCLDDGFEGVMIRDPSGHYKCGRATLKEGLLLKIKRFYEDEGIITGFIEKMHNANAKTKNELGLSSRASCLGKKVPMGTLGSFILDWKGHTLRCGTGIGLTDVLRQRYWDERESLLGQPVTFKYQKHGMKLVPRIPIFKGIRRDLN